jgi:hypothetical protein
MAVENQSADLIANPDLIPQQLNPSHAMRGKLRVAYFTFTQGTAGDANSFVNLVKLPQGRVRLFPKLSWLVASAFGAGRTLDVGVGAHKNINGTDVAAVLDSLIDGLDVQNATDAVMGTGTNATARSILVENFDGEATVRAKVLGAAIDSGETLSGYVVFAQE